MPVGRNLAGAQAFGPAERASMAGDQGGTLLNWELVNVDFDVVGILDQRLPAVARHEVIERDAVSRLLQPLARRPHLLISGNLVLEFDHHLPGRKQREVAQQEHRVRAVD